MSHPGLPARPSQSFETPCRRCRRALPCWISLALSALLLLPPAALSLNDAQQLVVDAWRLVNQSYVDPAQLEAVHWRQRRQRTLEQPIDSTADAYGAIDRLLAPLDDPYTRLLRPEDYDALRSNTRGKVSGVGLQLALRGSDQQIVVIAPLDGSPAAEAGILPGSRVLKVNGEDAGLLGLERTAALLRGPQETEVLVSLEAPGAGVRELELRRREVDLQPVRLQRLQTAGHRLAVLRITQFSEPVPLEVRSALESLTADPVEGLILDLRNNSGGLVSAGLAVADAFLDGDVIVETEDRGSIRSPQQANTGQLFSGPLVTLVNGGTASASEILAGALQDNGRSPLVGSRTFGKGLIQTLIPLGNGSGLAVTVARYLTPGGRDIQHLGIEPDLPLTAPEPLTPGGSGDTWLELALERLVAATGAASMGR